MHEVEKHLQFSSPPFFFIRSVLPSFECKTVIYEVLFYPLRLFALCICFPFRDECSFFFFYCRCTTHFLRHKQQLRFPLKKKKRKRMKRRNGTCSYLSLLCTCSHLFIAVDGDNRVLRVDVQLLYSITLENCSFSPFWAVMQSRRTCDSAAGFLHWFSIFIACSGFLFLFLK